MQAGTAVPTQARGLPYKWIVAIVVSFGLFMSILDETIVNIAIPRLQSAFGANLNDVQWVLTAYILAQGVATPLTAFFSERFSIKRFYLVALFAFTLGSALCGLAWSLPILIVFRILQGAGGAFLFPLSLTLLYSEFPPEQRGLAFGVLGIPILLGPALGPTLGGYLITFADWPLIFYINVPVGILGVLLAALLLRTAQAETGNSFDLLGFLLSATGLASLLYALSDASVDGWSSAKVLGFLSAGLLLLVIFVVVELVLAHRGRQPLLDLRVFANARFTSSTIALGFVVFGLFGGFFLFPIYLQRLRGLSAFQSGLVLLALALGMAVASVVGGRLVDRIGVKVVVIPGLLVLAFANWQFSSLTLFTSYGHFQLLLIETAFGLGLCVQPLLVSALLEIQQHQLAQASTVNTVVRFVASSLGIAVLATLVQTQTKIHYSHLAERVTPISPLGHVLSQLQALFMARGMDVEFARNAAIQVIIQQVQRQGYLLAIQDAFRLTLIFTGIAFVATLFIRSQRRATETSEAAPAEVQEGGAERREALLTM